MKRSNVYLLVLLLLLLLLASGTEPFAFYTYRDRKSSANSRARYFVDCEEARPVVCLSVLVITL